MTQKPVPEAVRPGLTGEAETLVCEHNVARHVDVFSTPSMVLLMERACVNAVHPHLDPSQTTVGYEVHLRHLAPTPLGMKVKATAVLEEVTGNRLHFRVEVHDQEKKVGEGSHKRAIVGARFGEKR